MTLEWSPKLYGIEIARVVLILWINGNKRTLLWRNYQSRFQPFSVPCCIIVAPKIWKEFNFCSNTAGWLGIKFWRRELRSFWRNAYPNNYRTVYTISVRKSKNYLGHIKYFFPVWAKKKTAEMSPAHTHFNLTTHRCEKTPRDSRPSLNAKQVLLNTFPLWSAFS